MQLLVIVLKILLWSLPSVLFMAVLVKGIRDEIMVLVFGVQYRTEFGSQKLSPHSGETHYGAQTWDRHSFQIWGCDVYLGCVQ